ncbi:hypothetical protein [Microbacterium sp.]|uniref:hypothetical protein n=1 Tax=Microbacterium sp. TaxID=51671 RepID=UPI00273546A2|nr:hypothetical protein [Microbacterium sp.]MDP3950652.1 hypothetical protein [Microbacterium sp.]
MTTWVRDRSGDVLTWIVVLGSFTVGYVSYVLRLPFFYPDSRYYLAMSFWFSGESQDAARDLTVEFADAYRVPVPPVDQLFGWGLVQPRVVLPFLAALPVRLFGPFGLAGTVLVIALVMTVLFTQILRRRYGNGVAVTVMLLVNCSYQLMMFNAGMLTESLSALWTALTLVVTWAWFRRRSWWLLTLMAATVALSAFTRQATFIVAGAFVVAWLLGSLMQRRWNAWGWPALVVASTALLCQVLQTAFFPSFSQLDQFLKKAEASSLGEALVAVPGMALRIIASDIRTFLERDLPLLVIILLALAGVVLFFRRPEAHLLLGAILGTALYNITNGTPTQFRYAIPGLIFFAIAAALPLSRANRDRWRIDDRRPNPSAISDHDVTVAGSADRVL